MRIAFQFQGGAGWIAGTHYLKNLFIALKSLELPHLQVILVVSAQEDATHYAPLMPYVGQVLLWPSISSPVVIFERLLKALQNKYVFREFQQVRLARMLLKHQVSIQFSMRASWVKSHVRSLCWVPDFQHLRLPEMFSQSEITLRDRILWEFIRYADRIVLSSNAALADFREFSPEGSRKARVLPFVAQVPSRVYCEDPRIVCSTYHLPERFIYLPNQFWKHKNHEIVVRALSLARQRCPEVRIVCTGNTHEYRDPTYFASLLATISKLDLRDNMILLGMIPHDHIFQLIRQCLAVLQPSLFEGWSTTVEEAKSVGKRIIHVRYLSSFGTGST